MAECLTQSEIEEHAAGRLPSGDCVRVESHLAQCGVCRTALDALREMNRRLGETGQTHHMENLSEQDGFATPTHGCESEPHALLAENLEGYEILREIHRGGQGAVYKAVQLATKRTVALKVLLQGPYASLKQRHRFEREIDLAASLQHPNIVTIYDSGVTQGRHYFAMEHIYGQSLRVYLSNANLSIEETLRLFAKLCSAVNYAHQHGVIHRDLKPENILIDAQGEPHVLDFGLAKAAGPDLTGGAPMTVTGEFMGTLAYASPEQTAGDPRLMDTRTDVYSLGLILYEMLTGKYPYKVMGRMADVLKNIAECEPKKPSTFRREIDNEVETIILKALSKERERRYQSVENLARDIDHYLAGRPIEAKRDSISYWASKVMRRWVARNHWAASLLVAVLAAALLYVAVFTIKEPLGRLDLSFDQAAQRFVPETWSDDVVVVSLDDATYNAIPRLSVELGLPQVSQKDAKSWRVMHGAVMRRLARAKPRVVAWDIKFSNHQPKYDGEFVKGIEALQSEGTKVIVGAAALDEQGRPVLSPPIIASVDGWGLIYLRVTREVVRGPLLAVVHPPYYPIPSLSLAAREAARYSDLTPSYYWHDANQLARLQVGFSRRARENPRLIQSSGEVYEHIATDVRAGWSGGVPEDTDCSNRYALYIDTIIPSPGVLAAHTVAYESVIAMHDADLRERFEGKIVVIGDNRLTATRRPDRSAMAAREGAREEFHCYMHATAICNMLERGSVRLAQSPVQFAVLLGVGLVCAVVGRLLYARRRWWLRWVVSAILSVLAVTASFVVTAKLQILLSPSGGILVIWLTVAGAAWVGRVYGADRQRAVG